jgi:predicted dienelactone hydrolase
MSHGLGGSREVGAYLANHWAGRGFAVVAMQHAGSDADVWKNSPPAQRLRVMKKAASLESFMSRTKDVPAVIDQITKWNGDKSHMLHGRFNMKQLGIGGHSFGAVTSQAVSGQSFGALGKKFTDKRINAALMLSPSPAKDGKNKRAFGQVTIPWMAMTGTKDTSIIKPELTAAGRLLVYPALPQGNKYELVLKDAKHMAFSDRTMVGSKQRNKNHHLVIKALSTAFWEAHLLDNKRASAWLQGDSPQQMLQVGDTWKRK